jgi:hypothetical protein
MTLSEFQHCVLRKGGDVWKYMYIYIYIYIYTHLACPPRAHHRLSSSIIICIPPKVDISHLLLSLSLSLSLSPSYHISCKEATGFKDNASITGMPTYRPDALLPESHNSLSVAHATATPHIRYSTYYPIPQLHIHIS